jgi:hypothetical protein
MVSGPAVKCTHEINTFRKGHLNDADKLRQFRLYIVEMQVPCRCTSMEKKISKELLIE